MTVIGHWGAAGTYPENTILSFGKAVETGVGHIEFDVQCCRTGEMLVIHDTRVDRVTNGSGYIWDYSFDDIRELDAGRGEKIPTLDEVLDYLGNDLTLHIELKHFNVAAKVAATLESRMGKGGWSCDNFVISSFIHSELRDFRKYIPDCRLAMLISHTPLYLVAFAEDFGAWSINQALDNVSESFVSNAHKRGIKVLVHTVNKTEDAELLKSMNVDGFFTDFPERFIKASSKEL